MSGRKLTKLQMEALARVCKTNGGGVCISASFNGTEVVPNDRVYRALYAKDLIQGKAGAYSTVVHTRAGLDAYRALLAEEGTPS